MGAQRRTARRGLRLIAGTMLIAGMVASPAAAASPGATPTRAGAAAPAIKAPATKHSTAARVAQVNPMRDGVARSAGSGTAFGTPTAATRTTNLAALRQAGATVPKRYNLPHWLPGRSTAATRTSAATAATHTSAVIRTTRQAISAAAAAAPIGSGLRSDFGMFGLSDADDSRLYPDCSVFQLCEEPPDPGVAVSATDVVQSVNELILIVDRATNGSRVIPNFDFFSLDNNQVTQSDPRVIYDAARDRWLATEISADCGHGYLHIAVSSSSDPFGTWNVYRLVFPGRVVDFPGVGTSSSTVVVSLNAFGADPQNPDCLSPGDFQGGMLAVVDWNDLEHGVPSLPVTTTEPAINLFTWRPALTAGGDPLARLVVAIDNGTDETSDVGYATISGTNATQDVTVSPVVNLTKTQGLAPFATPPAPHQPGDPATIVNAVDGQPTDAIAGSGHLWFIATAPCTPAGDTGVRDCVRLTELLTGVDVTTVAVAADTRFQEQGADLYMGGVGRATDGTLYVVYSRSSAADQIAGWATWRRSTESAFQPATLLIPPGGVYSGTRWGDYVILAADPARPDAVWQGNQVASLDGTWFTWLSQLRPAAFGPLDGTFRLNGGDKFTGETFVELQLSNPEDVALTVIRVANSPALRDGMLVGGQTLPVAATMGWSLAFDKADMGLPDGPRHVYVQWGDGLGHWSAVASDEIILDTTPPTVGAVSTPRIGTSRLTRGGAVPVVIQWQQGRDALSGLEAYDVERAADGSDTWETAGTTSGGVLTDSVATGHRYQWRVRAFDQLGNFSDFQLSPVVRIDAVDDLATTIHFDRAWRRATGSSSYRGGVHSATKTGATATFTFTGTSFGVAGTMAADRGVIDVFVDGRRAGRFVQTQARTVTSRIGFRMSLPAGRHTVQLVAADGRRVDIDAVILIR